MLLTTHGLQVPSRALKALSSSHEVPLKRGHSPASEYSRSLPSPTAIDFFARVCSDGRKYWPPDLLFFPSALSCLAPRPLAA